MATFAERLRELRKKNNVTQSQLAEQLGVAPVTVSIWERGVRKPEFETLDNICDFFSVSLGYLLGNEDIVGGSPQSNILADVGQGMLAAYYENMEHVLNNFMQLSDSSKRIIVGAIAAAYSVDKETGNLEDPQYTVSIRKNSSVNEIHTAVQAESNEG